MTAQHLDTAWYSLSAVLHMVVLYNKYSLLVCTVWHFVRSVLGLFIINLMYIGIYAQYVILDNQKSYSAPVLSGVAQGTILTLMLFLMCTNDLSAWFIDS